MKYPTLRFVFDRKKVATKTKKGLVQIEVTSERKRKWIGTGVKLYADQWNDRRKVINSIDMIALNDTLDIQMRAIQSWVNDLMLRKESFEFDKLDRFLATSIKKSEKYIDYVEAKIEGRTDIRESTKRTHRKLLVSLREYGQLVYFDELTTPNILAYDKWLHGKDYAQATIHSFHKINKKYIHEAMIEGLLDRDPYTGVMIDRGKSRVRRYLTPEEMKKIEDANIPDGAMLKIRDLFMFQCYTGLAYADLARFDFSKVIHRDGKYIVNDIRQKTEEQYYIVLLSPAVKILKKYNFKLPIISCQQYNLRLKVVADYAGLERNLTSHMGRHTFAVMCINNGIKMEAVSKMLGHNNIATTEIYTKVLNSEVEKAFDVMESKIKGGAKKKKPKGKRA